MNKPWFRNKKLFFKLDISGESGSSTEIDVCVLGSEKSGVTFAGIPLGSGTSILLTGGTTVGGEYSNGSYVKPLVAQLPSGATDFFHFPFLKFGFRASGTTGYLEAKIF